MLLSFIKINLEFTRNAKPEFSDLVDALSHYIPYLIGSIIYSIAVGIGFMLLVVPGVYIAIRYGFFSYFIIDRGEGVKDSFESSSFITRDAMKDLFVLGLILLGVNAVGLILCYISIGVVTTILINKTVGAFISFAGLLITVPIAVLAIAYVFRRLTAKRTRTAPRPS